MSKHRRMPGRLETCGAACWRITRPACPRVRGPALLPAAAHILHFQTPDCSRHCNPTTPTRPTHSLGHARPVFTCTWELSRGRVAAAFIRARIATCGLKVDRGMNDDEPRKTYRYLSETRWIVGIAWRWDLAGRWLALLVGEVPVGAVPVGALPVRVPVGEVHVGEVPVSVRSPWLRCRWLALRSTWVRSPWVRCRWLALPVGEVRGVLGRAGENRKYHAFVMWTAGCWTWRLVPIQLSVPGMHPRTSARPKVGASDFRRRWRIPKTRFLGVFGVIRLCRAPINVEAPLSPAGGCELARLVPGCQGGDSASPNRPRGRLCELDVPPTAARNGQFRAFAGGRDTPHEDAKLAAETWFGR
jgi:hypothetical protein